ncbi:hypothetical protein GBAR_LOCUS24948 [Geodia barretti]|uniref:Uncharacterized protein n=1 Tax=Geodia barretti TaxID=519541 RepID=A0AA35X4H6_GEOBA|nr:hypothetical protein GBAR_LOCUS24948 [Geodia barretti]
MFIPSCYYTTTEYSSSWVLMTLPKCKRLCGRRDQNGTTLGPDSNWGSLISIASILSQGLVWMTSSTS